MSLKRDMAKTKGTENCTRYLNLHLKLAQALLSFQKIKTEISELHFILELILSEYPQYVLYQIILFIN